MRIISATVDPIASGSVNAIATSQSGTANTKLTLASTPYTLDFPRRIIITSAGNDTGIKFAIVGTDWNGQTVTESLTGASGGAAQSAYDYSTVVSITPTENTGSTVQVGTNGVASTRPIFLDEWGFAPTSIQVNVTGTVNATVQQSLDDPNTITGGYPSVTWVNHPDTTNMVSITAAAQGNYAYPAKIVHLVLNSGTGSATIRLAQSAAVPF